ncbi:LpxI family protein [Thermosulfurimonas sp. F29]|uniref:LpxI family protein n=1 Tax=Thermosulfurimonas sp. F29 TaxID=2867247 RepID=UPI001C82DC46|nr:UDP-2,3-diacylglucosamine diphosphatase LpxI [Thermosulfurimonas sp. F29]MBX6423929.1 UDP-2,3-diacylglucosamine diphosphatase LpxI [Thermosulfurimonas sp. F29]
MPPGKPLGLVAGEGHAPIYFVERLTGEGVPLVVVTFSDDQAQRLSAAGARVFRIRMGQFGRLLKILREHDVQEVTFLGKIEKPRALREALPDLRALILWKRLASRNDDAILRAVCQEFEKEGFRVVSPAEQLPELLTPEGVLTRRAPSREEWKDIRWGLSVARRIGELDIGQCVVVKERMVVAVEAMEGTDETIRRAGRYRRGAVVIKILKPTQDPRLDLPSAGAETIRVMREAGARVLALEAGKSLFFEQDEAIREADRAGISIVGVR